MPKSIKITDEHFNRPHEIARAIGPGATPTHAFQSALDDAHAKHCAGEEPDESDPDDDGDAEPAPGEIGAPDENSMLPNMLSVTDTAGKDRAQRSLAARKANYGTAVTADNDPKAARAAVAAAADSVEAASDDLPPVKRGGKPNESSTTVARAPRAPSISIRSSLASRRACATRPPASRASTAIASASARDESIRPSSVVGALAWSPAGTVEGPSRSRRSTPARASESSGSIV